jgi:hypothetical protein
MRITDLFSLSSCVLSLVPLGLFAFRELAKVWGLSVIGFYFEWNCVAALRLPFDFNLRFGS